MIYKKYIFLKHNTKSLFQRRYEIHRALYGILVNNNNNMEFLEAKQRLKRLADAADIAVDSNIPIRLAEVLITLLLIFFTLSLFSIIFP